MVEQPSSSQKRARSELSMLLYGEAAVLPWSPPGPDTCPGSCDQCYHTDVPVLQPREPVEDERMRGVG